MKGLLARARAVDVIVALLVLSGVVMGAYFYAVSQTRSTLAICAAGSAMVLGGWAWYRFRPRSEMLVVRRLFPVALVALSLLYAFALTPGSVPDEPHHFNVSYYYSNLLSHPGDVYSVRAEDEDALAGRGILSTEIGLESLDNVKDNLGPFAQRTGDVESWEFTSFVDSFNVSANPIQVKLPSALGMLLAKALGLNSLWLYYLGMLFNLAFGVALIIAAVRIAPVGKNVFMAIALLPMTLHLLGSYSYDVGIIGLSMLLIALFLKAIYGEGLIAGREIASILIVACLLAPCKVLYTLIVFMAPLIPRERFRTRRGCRIVKTAMIVAPFAVVLLFRSATLITLSGAGAVQQQGDAPAVGGGEARTFTVSDIVSHPVRILGMLLGSTPIDYGWFYLYTLVGGSLGWFQGNIIAPGYVAVALMGVLAVSSLPSSDDGVILAGRERLVCLAIFLVAGFAVSLSMLLDWTASTDLVIQGVQGRYFLPVLPLLLLAARGRSFTAQRCLAFALVAVLTSIDATYIGFILYSL